MATGYYTEEEKARFLKSLEGNLQSTSTPYDQFIFVMVIFAIIVIGFFILFNLKKVRRYIWDWQVYTFILDFKSITKYERSLLSTLSRKYDINKKYDILTIEATYDRCAGIEIIKIEDSDISHIEKEKKIKAYNELKKKLFSADK